MKTSCICMKCSASWLWRRWMCKYCHCWTIMVCNYIICMSEFWNTECYRKNNTTFTNCGEAICIRIKSNNITTTEWTSWMTHESILSDTDTACNFSMRLLTWKFVMRNSSSTTCLVDTISETIRSRESLSHKKGFEEMGNVDWHK